MSDPRLKEVVHRDFGDCSTLAEVLSDQDATVFCLGAYTGTVPDAELRTITVDMRSNSRGFSTRAAPARVFHS